MSKSLFQILSEELGNLNPDVFSTETDDPANNEETAEESSEASVSVDGMGVMPVTMVIEQVTETINTFNDLANRGAWQNLDALLSNNTFQVKVKALSDYYEEMQHGVEDSNNA